MRDRHVYMPLTVQIIGLFFFSQCFQFATDNGTDLLKHEKKCVFFQSGFINNLNSHNMDLPSKIDQY